MPLKNFNFIPYFTKNNFSSKDNYCFHIIREDIEINFIQRDFPQLAFFTTTTTITYFKNYKFHLFYDGNQFTLTWLSLFTNP